MPSNGAASHVAPLPRVPARAVAPVSSRETIAHDILLAMVQADHVCWSDDKQIAAAAHDAVRLADEFLSALENP